MRNAIKHERCNADAHADFNNKTTRLLHLHFSFKNRMCTKYIRDERGLEVFFVHCGLPRLHFNKIIFFNSRYERWTSHLIACDAYWFPLRFLLNTSILFTITSNSWKSEAFMISKVFVTYYRVLFHARHRHLEQNTIGCLSKAVQPRNLSVSWQTGQGAARCRSSRRKL